MSLPYALALSAMALSVLGAGHCATMCGGFVAGAHRRIPSAPGSRRTLALPMHAGRILSYAAAGAVLGAVGALPAAATGWHALHVALFVAACLVLLFTGLRLAGWTAWAGERVAAGFAPGSAAVRLARGLGAPDTAGKAFVLGMLWGWAPCALAYGAAPLALVSGSAAAGAFVMAAFGLGTLPALAGAGWLLGRLQGRVARRWAGFAIAALALASLAQGLGAVGAALPAWLCITPPAPP